MNVGGFAWYKIVVLLPSKKSSPSKDQSFNPIPDCDNVLDAEVLINVQIYSGNARRNGIPFFYCKPGFFYDKGEQCYQWIAMADIPLLEKLTVIQVYLQQFRAVNPSI